MLEIALVLFTVTALAGATLLFCHFKFSSLPWMVVVFHGLAGGAALVVLVLAVVRQPTFGLAGVALVVLALAALSGFGNLALNLRRAAFHLTAVTLHALIAIVGIIVLLLATRLT